MTNLKIDEITVSSDHFIEFNFDGVFVLCWKMVGLPKEKYPDDETLKIIYQNTRKHYGEFSFEDILTAFELALNGKTKADVKHYHSVSASYVSEVLTGYKEYKRSKINALNAKLDLYSTDLLAEYEHKVKLNEESLKRMILNGYDHCLKGLSRRTAKIHTECADVLKQKKLYDIGASIWPDLLKKARLEFIDKQDNIRQAVKLADQKDHAASAKIMYVWAQFEAWKESEMMDLETLSGLLDEERILPADYNEKIEELTKHKNKLVV